MPLFLCSVPFVPIFTGGAALIYRIHGGGPSFVLRCGPLSRRRRDPVFLRLPSFCLLHFPSAAFAFSPEAGISAVVFEMSFFCRSFPLFFRKRCSPAERGCFVRMFMKFWLFRLFGFFTYIPSVYDMSEHVFDITAYIFSGRISDLYMKWSFAVFFGEKKGGRALLFSFFIPQPARAGDFSYVMSAPAF